jgi:lactoylglutathione lyase
VFTGGLVNLYTHDIDAGRRFYCELLGFRETFRAPREGAPEHVEFELNGLTLGLGTVEAAKRVHGVEATPGARAMAIAIWCDDVDEALQHLASAGVEVLVAAHERGNLRVAMVRDPDGNLVEIVASIAAA